MRTRDKILVGALATAGVSWTAREILRARRAIDLKDRVVVITGGSTGHGLLAARQAAEQGARLVVAARHPEDLNAAEAELRRLGAPDVLGVPTDVSDPEQARRLIRRTIERHGRIDILVNNAGTIQVGPLETMTLEDFQIAMATNFWGAVYCILAALPHMRERQFGRIANVVSVGGLAVMPHLAPYSASKFALTGLTRALRRELAKENILVTGIYPSTMRSGGHTHAWFKGSKQAEYTWFALSDSIPGVSVSADRVARTLWRAVRHGDAEVHVGWQTHLAVLLDNLMPNWSAEALTLVNRLLPSATATAGESSPTQGQDLSGTAANLMSRLVPPATRPGPAS